VQRFRRERDRPIGIEHDDVGVRAGRYRAFAWKEAEDLRGRCGGELDKAVQGDPGRRARRRRRPGSSASRCRGRRSGSSRSRSRRAAFPSCRTGSDRWTHTAGR
jgi:hypothetical protein